MTTKQCQNQLAVALTEWRPSTSFEDVVRAIQEKRDIVSPMPAFAQRHRSVRRWLPLVAAACVIAIIGVGSLLFLHQEGSVPPVVERVDTLVDIDVNPGIELSVGRQDKIVAVEAVNEDGRQVLESLELEQQPLSEVVEILFREMVEQGYIVGENNPVLITVQNADPAEAERIHGIINNGVDTMLSERSDTERALSVSVTNQTVEAFDAVTQFARKHGISNGKAAFILSMVEQQPTLEADALADYTFAALAAIAQHQEIPLSDLVDYDAEAGLWNLIADDLANEVEQAESTLGTSLVTPEKAKRLALEGLHNDWIAENALFVRVELAWEAEVPMYRVEFVSLGYLYEYAISAVDGGFMAPAGTTTTAHNGTIRSTLQGGGTRTDVNTLPTKTTTTTAPTTTMVPTTTQNGFTSEGRISIAQAKAIAVYSIGVEIVDVENISVGIHTLTEEYSVYFIYKNAVHVKYIHSISGDITKTVFMPLDTPVECYAIDEWGALEAALTHAGVDERDCGVRVITYWVSDGEPYITVSFEANEYSYSYRISGVNGSVVSYEITSTE